MDAIIIRDLRIEASIGIHKRERLKALHAKHHPRG